LETVSSPPLGILDFEFWFAPRGASNLRVRTDACVQLAILNIEHGMVYLVLDFVRTLSAIYLPSLWTVFFLAVAELH
jgi:hypothetical protein